MGNVVENLSLETEHIFQSQYPPVPIPDLTLPGFMLKEAELYCNKVAFMEAAAVKSYTYGDFIRNLGRFLRALRSLRLRKICGVIVVLPNVTEYAIVTLGIMASGGIFSGAKPALHASEIQKQVEATNATLIMTNESNYEKVKDLRLPVIILNEERIKRTIH